MTGEPGLPRRGRLSANRGELKKKFSSASIAQTRLGLRNFNAGQYLG
jgi:hypothetical protein